MRAVGTPLLRAVAVCALAAEAAGAFVPTHRVITRATPSGLAMHAGRHRYGLPARARLPVRARVGASSSTPLKRPLSGVDDVLASYRQSLRGHMSEEMTAGSVQQSLPSIVRTVLVVSSVASIAYWSCPYMLQLMAPLKIYGDVGTATTTITGVFMVPLGIVFGTMTSMTANVQRSRQLNVREVMYKEIVALDSLSHVLAKLFQRDPRRLLSSQAAVYRYCELFRQQIEPGPALSEERVRTFFAQRAALGTVYGQLAGISDREMAQAAFNFSPGQAGSDVGRAWDLVNTVQTLQASRSANLEHQFPFAHFALMAALGLCLPGAFLLVLLWGSPELAANLGTRVVYAAMCAILAVVFNLLLDMQEVFQGIYAIQPRRLRVVQAGIVNYMSRARSKDAISLDEYIKGYSTLWTDPGQTQEEVSLPPLKPAAPAPADDL